MSEEIKIGDKVRVPMNGKDWFPGVFEKTSDTFVEFGVRLDNNEVRYFSHIEATPDK